MREKTVPQIVAMILGIGFVIWVGWWCQMKHSFAPRDRGSGWITRREAEDSLGKRILLPDPWELQEWVNECPDVNIVVDGKLGPETAEGHGTAYMYQQGIYHCEEAGL